MAHIDPVAAAGIPKNHDEYYWELVSRNRHFVSREIQEKLRSLKMLVAGTGSTGGACVESVVRAGVEHLALADNGDYEMSNMNRQHARLVDMGKNKAAFHAEEVRQINPFVDVTVHANGITRDNVVELCEWADFIFDGVDVTTPEGIQAKTLLHETAHRFRKPVIAGLDLGFCQWGTSYDYRKPSARVFHGRLERVKRARHPIKALFEIYPPSCIPTHSIQLILDLLDDAVPYASQMGCASDLLSGIIVPAVLRYVEYGELVSGWNLDMSPLRYSMAERMRWRMREFTLRRKLHAALRAID